jgi:hypothetical protein
MANKIERDLDGLHIKMDAILDALGVAVNTDRQKRIEANEKARKAYMPGGSGWKQIHGNPHGESIEPAVPEGQPTAEDMEDPAFAAGFSAGVEAVVGEPGTVVMGDQPPHTVAPEPEAEAEPKGGNKANAKK